MKAPVSAAAIAAQVSRFRSFDECLVALRAALGQVQRPFALSFINAHGFNLCHRDKAYNLAMIRSDMILRDGTGMALLYKAMGEDPGQNFCGTDFIPYLLDKLGRKKIALIGTRNPYLQQAARRLTENGMEVVHLEHGFLEPGDYVARLKEARPELVLLGMGNPKQEKVAALLRAQLDFPCLLISGGAIIDYLGGKISRAPLWMRNLGVEWVYRLHLEPRRMFGRYVIGNTLFLLRLAHVKWRQTGNWNLQNPSELTYET